MSADEGAARRVAGAIAAQDPLLARDLIAAAREFLSTWGLGAWDDPVDLDYGTPEMPRIRRLQAFGAALEAEVGDEQAEADAAYGAFVVRTPEVEHRGQYEADAREAVREYVRQHGQEAARRDVEVFLRIEATGTSHPVGVERFLD